jgi:hypothetical protein
MNFQGLGNDMELQSSPRLMPVKPQPLTNLLERLKRLNHSFVERWDRMRLARQIYRNVMANPVEAAAAPGRTTVVPEPANDLIETLYRRSVPARTHTLLQLRVASRIGSAAAIEQRARQCLAHGWTDAHISASLLTNPGAPFSEQEVLLLRYADDVTRTPIDIDFKVVRRLEHFFGEGEMREIAACIVHEGFRIRYEDAIRVR